MHTVKTKKCVGLYSHLHSYTSGITAFKLVDWYHCKPNLNVGKIRSTTSIYKNIVVLEIPLYSRNSLPFTYLAISNTKVIKICIKYFPNHGFFFPL